MFTAPFITCNGPSNATLIHPPQFFLALCPYHFRFFNSFIHFIERKMFHNDNDFFELNQQPHIKRRKKKNLRKICWENFAIKHFTKRRQIEEEEKNAPTGTKNFSNQIFFVRSGIIIVFLLCCVSVCMPCFPDTCKISLKKLLNSTQRRNFFFLYNNNFKYLV